MTDIAKYLPPILRHDGVCFLNGDGALAVRDRRAYPFEDKWVLCRDFREAAAAIRAMVTQGGGPLEVSLQTLRLCARERDASPELFRVCAETLSAARPTNAAAARELARLLPEIEKLFAAGTFSPEAVDRLALRALDAFDAAYLKIGEKLEARIADGDGILTTCFAEHSFFVALSLARERGKRFRVFVPETRPYLQGARLTAPSLRELGFDAVLVTDGMPAHFMAEGKITKYVTASDAALRDGTVVNKVGTLANAIACAHFGIPYYATSTGIDERRERRDVVVELRDPEEVKRVRGVPITRADVPACYPCFDVVEPRLVTEIIAPEETLCPSMR